MIRLELLLQHLLEAFTAAESGQLNDAGLVVDEVNLDLPVEARFAHDGAVLMTLPRGIMTTGFGLQHGRLRLHCVEVRS
jgi:hypothetical protein